MHRAADGLPAPGLPPVHGGLDTAELAALGLRPEDVLDLSANISPWGPPPGVLEAVRRADVARYPDPQCIDLRRALASGHGVPPECILAGNGSTEIITLLARACLDKGSRAAIFTPTFSEYEAACRAVGAHVTAVPAGEEDAFHWDLEQARRQLTRLRPRLLFLCNPNNPTGVYLSGEEMLALLEGLPHTVVALDEAFVTYPDRPWDSTALLQAIPKGVLPPRNELRGIDAPEFIRGSKGISGPLLHHKNVVLVRSLTKDFALPGLRLGYAVADAGLVRALAVHQPRWSVNALAQAAGVAALREGAYLATLKQRTAEARELLTRELRALGLEVTPSQASFVLVKVGDAAGVRLRLLREHRVCVRDCASFGLPRHVRIAVRTAPECRRLLSALGAVLQSSASAPIARARGR